MALNVGASNKWGLEVPAGWTEVSIGHERDCDGIFDAAGVEECTFFAKDSIPSSKGPILLIGDSHASALSDGVIEAARQEGYDVIVRWMASCPFFKDRPIAGYEDCATWQDMVVELIEEEKPALVIMSVYASNYILSPHHRQESVVASATGQEAKTQQDALQSWADALEGTLSYFEDQEIPVIAMSPVPFYERDFTQWISLFRPDPKIPNFTRDEVRIRQEAGHRTNHEVVSRFEGARLFDPLDYLCDDKICAAAGEEGWLYRDDSHINAAGSMRLSPGLQRTIREALEHSESERSAPGPREEVR
jgi:lysophospholipase L1-like esterase